MVNLFVRLISFKTLIETFKKGKKLDPIFSCQFAIPQKRLQRP